MDDQARATRTGTETRKRQPRVYSRVTEAERTQIEQDAAALGLSVGCYLRSLAIHGNAETRPVRRPLADVAMLAQVKGQIGRVGGNVHQLLRLANRGEIPEVDELRQAAQETLAMLAAISDILKGAL